VVLEEDDFPAVLRPLLRRLSGARPVVVLSDDPTASRKIAAFADSGDRWMVAVRMVSEGVDIPRLAVGVYATSVGTALFFAQAVGRFVRARQRGETASVFLPSVPVILEHAARLEQERDHALDRVHRADDAASIWAEEDALLAAANRTARTTDLDELAFEALESDAEFDHVLFDAQQFGLNAEVGSQDEQEFLGLPGLLEPDQMAVLLHERQAAQSTQRPRGAASPAPVSAHRALAAQRQELNKLVAAYARKTGAPHGVVHNDLRRACGGPALDEATSQQVGVRITRIRDWFVGRR
jgi:hypothetical protein